MDHLRQGEYKQRLGACGNLTIAQSGCFVVSLAMLSGLHPVATNKRLVGAKAFARCNELSDKKAAAHALGIKYGGAFWNKKLAKMKAEELGTDIIICETRDNQKYGVFQHFFIYNLRTGLMSDPLSKNKKWEKLKYSIKSYRIFSGKKEEKTEDFSEYETEVDKEKNIKGNLEDLLRIAKKTWKHGYKEEDTPEQLLAASMGRIIKEIQKDLGF